MQVPIAPNRNGFVPDEILVTPAMGEAGERELLPYDEDCDRRETVRRILASALESENSHRL